MSEIVEELWNHDDFDWDEYTVARPTYPKELYKRIFLFHEKGGGKWEHALDIGCGPGIVTEVLADRFGVNVIGSDINNLQLNYAKKRLAHLTPKVSFRQSPGESLPWVADSSIDLITSAEAIHWMDSTKFLAEAARVLRPGGTVALWYYYPPVVISGNPEASSLHQQMLLKSMNDALAKSAGRPVTENFLATERSELDNIHFPLAQFTRETRIKWNRHPDDWYTFGRPPLERIDNKEPTSEGYHHEEVNDPAFMSREFTIAEFRKYLKSLSIVQNDEWPAMDESLRQIAQLVSPENKITASWTVVLVMASRR